MKARKDIVLLIVVVSISIAILTVPWTSNSEGDIGSGQTLVVLEPSKFDLGRIWQGETIDRNLKFLNQASEPIQIIKSESSCGCTVATDGFLGKIIQPGGSINIPISFNSGESDGVVTTDVTITAASENGLYRTRSSLTADVVAEFKIEPSFLDLGTVQPGRSISGAVDVVPNAAESIEILGLDHNKDFFETSVFDSKNGQHSEIKEISSKSLHVTFNAPEAVRKHTYFDVIEIRTSSKRMPIIRIDVQAHVAPPLRISPDVLVMSGLREGSSRFTISTESPSRITRLTAEHRDSAISKEWNGNIDSHWKKNHSKTLANTDIFGASALNVELEIQIEGEADQTEVRSVSLPIRYLH